MPLTSTIPARSQLITPYGHIYQNNPPLSHLLSQDFTRGRRRANNLRSHLRPGCLYRRADLEKFSKSVDRELAEQLIRYQKLKFFGQLSLSSFWYPLLPSPVFRHHKPRVPIISLTVRLPIGSTRSLPPKAVE